MKQNRRNKWIFGILTLLWMGFIFMMSRENGESSAEISGNITGFLQKLFFKEWNGLSDADFAMSMHALQYFLRKAAHFTEYLILGGLLTGFLIQFKKHKMSVFVYSWCLGTLYAVTDELHQMFVADRACQVFDICIDSAGVLLGILAFSGVFYLRGLSEASFKR